MIPSIAGPLVAIILLSYYGNHWTFDELRPVFIVGVILEFPPAVLSFFMRDDLALANGGEEVEGEGEEQQEQQEQQEQEQNCCLCITKASVPYVLFTSSLLTALGSGMTIKFFPLFFKQALDLSPRSVQIIYVLVPLLVAVFTKMNELVAKCIGRIQTILVSNLIGVGLLVTMSVLVDLDDQKWYIIIPIYLLRTGYVFFFFGVQ
jgi:hypothetical protein